MNETDVAATKKRGRGKGKKLALAFTSIRLEPFVMKFFKENYPKHGQAKMREVLRSFVDQQSKEQSNEEAKQSSTNSEDVIVGRDHSRGSREVEGS